MNRSWSDAICQRQISSNLDLSIGLKLYKQYWHNSVISEEAVNWLYRSPSPLIVNEMYFFRCFWPVHSWLQWRNSEQRDINKIRTPDKTPGRPLFVRMWVKDVSFGVWHCWQLVLVDQAWCGGSCKCLIKLVPGKLGRIMPRCFHRIPQHDCCGKSTIQEVCFYTYVQDSFSW